LIAPHVRNHTSLKYPTERRKQRRQLSIEQAPAPLGSPHAPQAGAESDARVPALVDDTANVDILLATSTLLQDGHAGAAVPYTIFSKRFPQRWQSYS
jgi:hypothetical protein